jgi:hypothetical protein
MKPGLRSELRAIDVKLTLWASDRADSAQDGTSDSAYLADERRGLRESAQKVPEAFDVIRKALDHVEFWSFVQHGTDPDPDAREFDALRKTLSNVQRRLTEIVATTTQDAVKVGRPASDGRLVEAVEEVRTLTGCSVNRAARHVAMTVSRLWRRLEHPYVGHWPGLHAAAQTALWGPWPDPETRLLKLQEKIRVAYQTRQRCRKPDPQ